MTTKFRVPIAFLLLPCYFFAIFALIAGGVAWSQRPYADWSFCLILLGCLLACAAAYRLAPIEWISDDELMAMKAREEAAAFENELEKEVREGTLEKMSKRRRWWGYASIALCFAALFVDPIFGSVKVPGSGTGVGMLGRTLGIWRLFGHEWTGVELLAIAGLLYMLYRALIAGSGRLVRAQRRD